MTRAEGLDVGSLRGKVALVTGSSRGIGRAIAEEFAAWGVRVAMNARNEGPLDEAIAMMRKAGYMVHGVAADVSQEEDVGRLFNEVVETFGQLDILVNSAGGGHGAREFHLLTNEDLWQVIRVDLVGALLCCREAVRRMASRGGCIINIVSQAGRVASDLAGPHYAAAKAGVIGLTRQLARDYGPSGVRVNAIAPGITLVERVVAKLEARSLEDRQRMLDAIPLGRFAEPREIAAVAVFLASDASRYITGATIDVNGGRFTV